MDKDYAEKVLMAIAGKKVIVALAKAGSAATYNGTVLPGPSGEHSWIVRCERAVARNQMGKITAIIPETDVIFSADDLWYVAEPRETKEEAQKKISEDAEAKRPVKILTAEGGEMDNSGNLIV
jgi:hypothetical protein